MHNQGNGELSQRVGKHSNSLVKEEGASKTQDANQSGVKTRMSSIIKQNGEAFMKQDLQQQSQGRLPPVKKLYQTNQQKQQS